MKKYFWVKATAYVTIPVAEALLDGRINRNHLMFVAQAKLDQQGIDTSTLVYEHEFHYEQDKRIKKLPLSHRFRQEAVTLDEAEKNKELAQTIIVENAICPKKKITPDSASLARLHTDADFDFSDLVREIRKDLRTRGAQLEEYCVKWPKKEFDEFRYLMESKGWIVDDKSFKYLGIDHCRVEYD